MIDLIILLLINSFWRTQIIFRVCTYQYDGPSPPGITNPHMSENCGNFNSNLRNTWSAHGIPSGEIHHGTTCSAHAVPLRTYQNHLVYPCGTPVGLSESPGQPISMFEVCIIVGFNVWSTQQVQCLKYTAHFNIWSVQQVSMYEVYSRFNIWGIQ